MIINLLKNIFFVVYLVELTTADNSSKHVFFQRELFAWDAINAARIYIARKGKKDGKEWVITDIRKL